tara:strand:+ start:353 stop:883 length:531 start_codon:yes stop_codon:yes gene_type:complete
MQKTELDVCAVCLSECDVTTKDTCYMPGCLHVFHTSCLLQCAQRDARCPICRQVPNELQVSATTPSREAPSRIFEIDVSALRQQWVLYDSQRRARIDADPIAKAAQTKLRGERRCYNAAVREAKRVHAIRAKQLWNQDPELKALRRVVQRKREKTHRLERIVEDRVDTPLRNQLLQ